MLKLSPLFGKVFPVKNWGSHLLPRSPKAPVLDPRYADIRDRGLEFYDSSNVGYENIYLVSRDGHDDPESGIIISKQFYARVLYDTEEHLWVALASPFMEALHRSKNPETGKYHLSKVKDDPDIYRIASWSANLSGSELRKKVNYILNTWRDDTMYNEQFYMDTTPILEDDIDGEWAIRSVNTRLGFYSLPLTVTEDNPPPADERPHRIYARASMRPADDNFVRFPDMPQNSTLSFLDQSTNDPRNLATTIVAITNFTNAAATNFRKGKPDHLVVAHKKANFSAIQNETLRTVFERACDYSLPKVRRIIQTIGEEYNNTVNTKWKEALCIGLGLGAAVTVQQHIVDGSLQSLPKNLLLGTVGALSFKFREELVGYVWNRIKDADKEEIRINGEKSVQNREYGYIYDADIPDNKKRRIRKVDAEKVRNLIALDHQHTQIPPLSLNGRPEAIMDRHNNEKFLREYRYLSIRERLYGSNIAMIGHTNMGWELYTNGGVCFRHVEKGEGYTLQHAYFSLDRKNAASKKVPLDILQEIADSQDALKKGTITEDALIQVKRITSIRGRLPDNHILAKQFPHSSPYQLTFSEKNMRADDAYEEIQYLINTTIHESTDTYGNDHPASLTETFENYATPLSPLGAVQRLTELERRRRKVALENMGGEGTVSHLKPKSRPNITPEHFAG